jgi:Flp pilus assembly protein TadD
MNPYSLFLAALALVLSGCRPVSSQAADAASLGAPITLAPAERAVFAGQALVVQFISVAEDSRCPSDTTCVWAGEAIVRLAVEVQSEGITQHAIAEGQSASLDPYRVSILAVQPQPVSTHKISPAEYRVTLTVERTAG